MTITRGECFCDNPECRATTSAGSKRFRRWEVIAAEAAADPIEDAHLCERCAGRRAEGRSLQLSA